MTLLARFCLASWLLMTSPFLYAEAPPAADALPGTRALRYQGTEKSAPAMTTATKTTIAVEQLLAAKPPTGSISERRAFWYRQNDLVRQLGDPVAWRKIVDAGLIDLHGDDEGEQYFRGELWGLTRSTGTPLEILAMGEDMLARYPNDQARYFEASRENARFQRFTRAEELLEKGRAVIARKKLDAFGLRSSEYNLSTALRDLATEHGQLDDAIKHAIRVVEVSDWRGNEANIPDKSKRYYPGYRANIVGSRRALVSLLIRAGALDKAREKQIEVERISEQLKLGGIEQLYLLGSRAQIEMAAGNFKAALDVLQRSEQQYIQLGASDTSSWLIDNHSKQITTLLALGRFTESANLARKLDISAGNDSLLKKRTGPGADRVMLFWHSGQLDKALKKIQDISTSDRQLYGTEHYLVLRNAALLQAIAFQQTPSPQGLSQLGELSEKLIADHSALASNAVQKIYQRAILEAYLQGLATNGNRDAAAIESGFHIAEALRESAVGDVVTQAARRSAGRQPGLSDLVARQRNLKLTIDASYDNLASAQSRGERDEKIVASLRQTLRTQQDEQLQTEKDLARRFPEYNQLTSAEPTRLKDVTRLLNRNEALISILPTENATFVWVLTRDRPPVFFASKLNSAAVRGLVGQSRLTLDVGARPLNQIPSFNQTAARQLYDELLAPARSVLMGRSHLIVNAADPLGQLPFTTLVSGPETPRGPAWLVRDYAVTHIPSVGAFASLRQTGFRAAASKPFIGFGDPLFNLNLALAAPVSGTTRNLALPRSAPQEDLAGALKNYGLIPQLPETRDELLAMAGALGADLQQDVFLGKAATRTAVLKATLADYQVVSFSTHGLMAGDLPGLTQPALALAATGQAGESPLLTLEDVLGLKLNADWVVLSACNTAAADGEASEALSGLGRGFFYAGARALLVTHWAVESASAQQLVTETFKRYAEDKSLSRAEALRQAQLKLIENKRYAHPFYWAPYALVGDGG